MPVEIVQRDDSTLDVTMWITWFELTGGWLGDGRTNGDGIRYMIPDDHNPYYGLMALIEGRGEDLDGDGFADLMTGVYKLMDCKSDGICDREYDAPWMYYWDGEWEAVRVEDSECDR